MENIIARTQTKQIKLGNITIGGQNKVLIQSMCNVKTSRVKEVVDQINKCAFFGADLMRVSVLDLEDAKAIKDIKKSILIPLIADIHFDYNLAIESIKSGADAIRINPGNIGSIENVLKVLDCAKEHNVVIRIGVNSGSLEKDLDTNKTRVESSSLVESASKMIKLFEDNNFFNIVISLKGSNVKETVKAYKLASKSFKYPLHLGITEAGPSEIGIIRSVSGLSPLLLEGIGDTIRISLSDDPAEEVKTCRRLLKDLEIRNDYPNFISCPTCGRTQVNLIPLAKKVLYYLEENNIKLTVAIMGCIVNGPGEAKHADIGLAGGKNCWVLFKKGQQIKTLSSDKAFDELILEIKKMAI